MILSFFWQNIFCWLGDHQVSAAGFGSLDNSERPLERPSGSLKNILSLFKPSWFLLYFKWTGGGCQWGRSSAGRNTFFQFESPDMIFLQITFELLQIFEHFKFSHQKYENFIFYQVNAVCTTIFFLASFLFTVKPESRYKAIWKQQKMGIYCQAMARLLSRCWVFLGCCWLLW